jgi:hypothetical protein
MYGEWADTAFGNHPQVSPHPHHGWSLGAKQVTIPCQLPLLDGLLLLCVQVCIPLLDGLLLLCVQGTLPKGRLDLRSCEQKNQELGSALGTAASPALA